MDLEKIADEALPIKALAELPMIESASPSAPPLLDPQILDSPSHSSVHFPPPPPPITSVHFAPTPPPIHSKKMAPTPSIVSRNGDEFENRVQDLADFETSWLISQVRSTGSHGVLLDDTEVLPEPSWAKDLLATTPPRSTSPKPRRTVNLVTGPMMGRTRDAVPPEGIGCCGYILMGFSWLLIVLTLPFSLCLCIKVVQEYERAVIFRLGRLLAGGAKGPGLFFIIPCLDSYTSIDLRTVSFDVPPQEVLSKDSVTVAVDAVVYYRVQNATISITNVEDSNRSTRLLAATTLRNVLGTKNLSEILSDRENISNLMQHTLDEATDPWGVKVERVEVKDVRLPVQLQRAMAAEAEAAREARAKVIAAQGEKNASRALKEASDIMSESSSALQLRYLQTLNTISAEKNSTIIFPIPIDLLANCMRKPSRKE